MAFSKQVIAVALLALSAHQSSAAEYYEFSEGQMNPPSATATSTQKTNILGDLPISGGVEWIGDKRKGIQFNGTSQLQTPTPFKEFMKGNDDGITLDLWLEVEDTVSYSYAILTNRNKKDQFQKSCSKGSFALTVAKVSAGIEVELQYDLLRPKPFCEISSTISFDVEFGVESEPLHIIVTMDRNEHSPPNYEMRFAVHAGYGSSDLTDTFQYVGGNYAAFSEKNGETYTADHWYDMFGSSDPLSIGQATNVNKGRDLSTPFIGTILALGFYDKVLNETEIKALHAEGPPNSRPQKPTDFTQEVGEDAIENVPVCESSAGAGSGIVDGITICTDVDEDTDKLKIVIDSLPVGCDVQYEGRCGILLSCDGACVDPDYDSAVLAGSPLEVGAVVKIGNLFYGANPNDHSYTYKRKNGATITYEITKNVYASFTYHLLDTEGTKSLIGTAKFRVRPAVDDPISIGQDIDIYSGQTKNIQLSGTNLDSLQPGAEVTYTRALIPKQPSDGKLTDSNDNVLKVPETLFSVDYPDLIDHPCYTTPFCLEIDLDDNLQYEADEEKSSASGQEIILSSNFTFFIESRSINSTGELKTSVSTNPGTIMMTHKNPLEVGGRLDVDEDRPDQQLKLRDATRLMGAELKKRTTYYILSVPGRGYIYQLDTKNETEYITEKEVEDKRVAGGVDVDDSSGYLQFQHWDLENEYNCGPSDSRCNCNSPYCTAEENFTSFTIQAVNEDGFKSAPGTLYVNVKPYNDDPTLNVDSLRSFELPAVVGEATTWTGNITLFDDFDPYSETEVYTTTIDLEESRVTCLVSIARDDAGGKYGSLDPRLRGAGYVTGEGNLDDMIVITSERTFAQDYLQRLVFTVPESETGTNAESRCEVTVKVQDGKGGEAEKTFDMTVKSDEDVIAGFKSDVEADLVLVYGIWIGAGLFMALFVGIIGCKIRDQCKRRKKASADDNINPYLHAT